MHNTTRTLPLTLLQRKTHRIDSILENENSVRAIEFAPSAPISRWKRGFQSTIEQIPFSLFARVQQRPSSSAIELRRDLPELRSFVVPRRSDRIEEPRAREDPVSRAGNVGRYRPRTGDVIDFVRRCAEIAITGRFYALAANLARRYHHQLQDRANFLRLPRCG